MSSAKEEQLAKEPEGSVSCEESRNHSITAQIIPYGDTELEMLFRFGKFLVRKLQLESEVERLDLEE